MVEAVQTRTSTFGIWVIVVVTLVCLAAWLVSVSVADSMQTRESRRWWQRLHAPEPMSAGDWPSELPGQRRGDEQGAGRPAVGQEAAADQAPATEPERHARPTIDGAGDFRRDSAEADWRTEAPTRPDLPAQAAPTGQQAVPTGQQAVPTQRTGDADRAARSRAGPDAARQDDDPDQQRRNGP